MYFICPKCNEKLLIEDGRAVCINSHSYDRSRAGYYNLLLSSARGVHGDNKQMVMARRAFLSEGFYQPLESKLSELVLTHTAPLGTVLDAGAGEGYYTDAIERAIYMRDGESRVSAFDISKDAVREIARKNSRIELAVAGSYHMPIADGTFDTVVNTFSPLALSETLRVLKRGGIFIMAIVGVEHLFELKSVIYTVPYKNTVMDTALEGFELLSDDRVKYTMRLTKSEDVRSLFMMTPYAYRTREEDRRRIDAISSLDCTADFRIFVYRRQD